MAKTKKTAAAAEKETKKTVKAAEVKAEAVETKIAEAKPVETKADFFVEFGGVQVAAKDVLENIKKTIGKDAKEIAVYLKPEESKAYFVADGEKGEMDVYFC